MAPEDPGFQPRGVQAPEAAPVSPLHVVKAARPFDPDEGRHMLPTRRTVHTVPAARRVREARLEAIPEALQPLVEPGFLAKHVDAAIPAAMAGGLPESVPA